MKTFFLILSIFAFNSFASDLTPNWKELSKKSDTAKNAKEFLVLQKKYPELLEHFSAKNVVKASVTTVVWKYSGATTCEAADARLLFTGRGVQYCNKQGAATVCSTSAPMSPWSDADPCLYP